MGATRAVGLVVEVCDVVLDAILATIPKLRDVGWWARVIEARRRLQRVARHVIGRAVKIDGDVLEPTSQRNRDSNTRNPRDRRIVPLHSVGGAIALEWIVRC